MTPATQSDFGSDEVSQHDTKRTSPEDEMHLHEALKRCSARTLDAARQFRKTRDPGQLPIIVLGVIQQYIDGDLRAKLMDPGNDLRLIEDLAIDSLTLMEIMILLEDVFQVSIADGQLRHIRTLGDIREFLERKLCGQSLHEPKKMAVENWNLQEQARLNDGPPSF